MGKANPYSKRAKRIIQETTGIAPVCRKIMEQVLLTHISGHVKGKVVGKSWGSQGGQGQENLPCKWRLVGGTSLVLFSLEKRRL